MVLPAPSARITSQPPQRQQQPTQSYGGTAGQTTQLRSVQEQRPQQPRKQPGSLSQAAQGFGPPGETHGCPPPRRLQSIPSAQRGAAPVPPQLPVRMNDHPLSDSDEGDWDVVDQLVAKYAEHAHQAGAGVRATAPSTQAPAVTAGFSHRSLSAARIPDKSAAPPSDLAADHPAGRRDTRQPSGELCKHGVPLLSCALRAEHLTEVKEALFSVMATLLDNEGDMSMEEENKYRAEHRRLRAQQQALEKAPPGGEAQRAAGPVTPGDRPIPTGPSPPYDSNTNQNYPGQGPQSHAYQAAGGYNSHSESIQNGAQQPSMGFNSMPYEERANDGFQSGAGFGDRGGSERPGTCHICGEAGHWASTCSQRGGGGGSFPNASSGEYGSGGATGYGGGGGGGGMGAYNSGNLQGAVGGSSGGSGGALDGEMRAPDPSLRGGASQAGASVACKWQEGTNDKRWSRTFSWSKVPSSSTVHADG